jgi:hypothetical protein
MINKIFWSDETKIELFGLNAKHLSSPGQYHPYCEAYCGVVFQWHEMGERVEGKINRAKYIEILDEILLHSRPQTWVKVPFPTGQ